MKLKCSNCGKTTKKYYKLREWYEAGKKKKIHVYAKLCRSCFKMSQPKVYRQGKRGRTK